MTMAQLLALGCPPLPDGMFYRIRSSSYFFWLELRRDNKRFGSRWLAEEMIRQRYPFWTDDDVEYRDVTHEEAIRITAGQLLKNREKELVRYAWKNEVRALIGDHR